LAAEEAEELSRRSRATTVSVRDRQRAEIILLSARGLTQQRIAEQLGISRLAVNRWVGRFARRRLEGLGDRGGRGRKPWLPQAAVQQVLQQAVTPPPHLGRWSCRTMARAATISPASVQRLWAASDIKPHLSRTFKLSNDQRFEEKFWDVIGLYLNPPNKALVLCCDEKSQCEALVGRHGSQQPYRVAHDTVAFTPISCLVLQFDERIRRIGCVDPDRDGKSLLAEVKRHGQDLPHPQLRTREGARCNDV
jgi:transposase